MFGNHIFLIPDEEKLGDLHCKLRECGTFIGEDNCRKWAIFRWGLEEIPAEFNETMADPAAEADIMSAQVKKNEKRLKLSPRKLHTKVWFYKFCRKT